MEVQLNNRTCCTDSRLGGAEGGILTISLLALLVADTVALEIGDRLLARGRHRKVVEFWGELCGAVAPAGENGDDLVNSVR